MSAFFKDFGISFKAYGKALDLIFTKGLWWFFIFPILLNVLMWFGGYALMDALKDYTIEWITGSSGLQEATFWGADFIRSAMSGFFLVVFKITFFFIFATFGGYIVLIVLSPVFAYLSEKTEQIITGKDYPFDGDQLMRDIVRGVLIAMRNLMIETGYMLAAFILGFIPLIGQLAGIVLFFISSYFYGFSFMDYVLERQRLTVRQSVLFIREHKGAAVANGLIFSIFMFIPFCGMTLAGFMAIIATVAATISTLEVVDNVKRDNFAANNQQKIEG